MDKSLNGKSFLVTGGARRVGKIFAFACARAGENVVIHHGHADDEAEKARQEITEMGCRAWVFEADLNDPAQAKDLMAPLLTRPCNAVPWSTAGRSSNRFPSRAHHLKTGTNTSRSI